MSEGFGLVNAEPRFFPAISGPYADIVRSTRDLDDLRAVSGRVARRLSGFSAPEARFIGREAVENSTAKDAERTSTRAVTRRLGRGHPGELNPVARSRSR